MSVAELPSAQSAPAFDRTPPQDIEAEKSVLGGMLLSKDAIAEVIETLRAGDFYRPAHATIHDVILDLYARGEPADPVTVSAELTRKGELARVGGAPYLHTLVAAVPTAANAAYYARIVRERAVLRRLVEAGTRIVQLGYAGRGGEVDDLVDAAQEEVYAVTERRGSTDYARLSEIMQGALDEIEAISSRGGEMVGVPTGFADLDELTNGLHPGQMIILAARPAIGKALAVDTPLPTPTGWTTMGEVAVGDFLIGADGRPTRVIAATDVMEGRPCYEVVFSDGTVIVADEQHQWLTETRASRQSARAASVGNHRYRNLRTCAAVRTTQEIAKTLRCPTVDRRLDHSVANVAPLQLPEADLPLPPYALGVRLGDGASKAAHSSFRAMGVPGAKRIPTVYLRASESQRRALLAGLLDADGSIAPYGAVQFTTMSRKLAGDVRELVVGLGYRCGMSSQPVKGRSPASSTAFTITFSPQDQVFRLQRKKVLHRKRSGRALRRVNSRFIVDVRPVSSTRVRCVEVDNDRHLYLASRSMIPTHNSTLGLDLARSAAVKHGLTTAIFSLEMTRNEITMRLLSAEARVALHHMRSGTMTDEDWTRLARRMSEVAEAPLFIDDSPNMTMMEIRAKCRRLKQRHDLRMVIVDYMQLMTSGKRVESRQLEVSEFSRSMKLLAKELDVPVVAISQLNRGPEQRTDKKPLLSDLRESGCLPASTRVLRADTGVEVSLGELLDSAARDVPVWSLDASLRLVARRMTHVFPSGRKEIFRLRLTSGRMIEATANHPFLSYDGWRPLGELAPGDRLATPRRVPAPLHPRPWPDAEVVMLAHLIGDSSFVTRQSIRYASTDEADLAAVTDAARHFGVTAVRDDPTAARSTSLRLPAPDRLTHDRGNPIADWLDGLGVFGRRTYESFVPPGVFSLPDGQLATFLRHLWATGGSVTWDARQDRVSIYYASTSKRLVDDVARLLLRFGVLTRGMTIRKPGDRDGYHLHVCGAENQLRFLDQIGVHGARGVVGAVVAAKLRQVVGRAMPDTIPREVWHRVRGLVGEQSLTHRQHAPTRAGLARVAAVLDSADLQLPATNDVCWDEVASIERLGEQDVFDATVLGTHNFIADGIAVHNSLEQDADMVILMHREDAYERESPRAGEADLIVAKHRNGPTRTITVAFQGHYSRFVDMARH